jgi:hypothetical protein
MFNLKTRINFKKGYCACLTQQDFNCTGAHVARCCAYVAGSGMNALTLLISQEWSRGFLYQLLITLL